MNPERSSVMTAHYIPCVGHLGLISYFASWTGGYRAMGKIADEAKAIYDKALQLDEMVVICVALECIPQELAALISKKVKFITLSRAGPHCDGQYLFAVDLLSSHNGYYSRHGIRYDHFTSARSRRSPPSSEMCSRGPIPRKTT